MTEKEKKLAGTFSLNKNEAIHRWFSYMEGYSSSLVERELELIGYDNVKTLYDPFGGSGTSLLTASEHNIKPYYSEINPVMGFICDTKINSVISIRADKAKLLCLKKHYNDIDSNLLLSDKKIDYNGFEKFYETEQLQDLLSILCIINKITDKDVKNIAKVGLASIAVQVSKMIRRGDLRYAKGKEKEKVEQNVKQAYLCKLQQLIEDISDTTNTLFQPVTRLTDDSRNIDEYNAFDCVITSPPYLNGTNYIRNTKLELKLLEFIESEKDLPALHSKGIIAGINSVSKRSKIEVLPIVKPYIDQLEPVAYDKRIPLMVAGYFYDMNQVFLKLSESIKPNGKFIMDIGDSQFCGVHIPTHEILEALASQYGFYKYDEEVLRVRHSNNGFELSQRVLRFENRKVDKNSFAKKAEVFINKMPYRQDEFGGRNWGHPWHSLCSYHGKLKPSIAHFLVKNFTEPGDVIFDPLSGVGTIPFEACLQGRIGIGNDISRMAYAVTKAKVTHPALKDVNNVIDELDEYIEENKSKFDVDPLPYSNFGFNGKIPEYFHHDTYLEILAAREFFKNREINDSEAMVLSAFLHVLHGNRPYALSRKSHPLTPYKPTGEYVYKSVIKHIKDKIELTYKKCDIDKLSDGSAILGDFADLDRSNIHDVDIIICSPPFTGSIKFYIQNWMRLWCTGWEPHDFKEADVNFLEAKQKDSLDVYEDFFKMCFDVLKPRGKVILHLGNSKECNMADELEILASKYFSVAYKGAEAVSTLEKHGIKDKGATFEHQFLFLEKNPTIKMKALTLIQPWATLIQLGEKQIETRSWSTKYRGTVAIHAGKKVDKKVFSEPYYKEVLKKHNITVDNIPTSSIVALCDIDDVKPTTVLKKYISDQEKAFGDYSPRRYGWILKNVRTIKPVPYDGHLGLWNAELKAENSK